MNSLRVLDVTLRDGGCVNDFDFGQQNMEQILTALEQSGADVIELGYLDRKNGSSQGRTQYCSEQVIPQTILKKKKPGTTYVAMMDYGKYDAEQLLSNDGRGIDGIRVAFHKKDRHNAVCTCKRILEKGYRVYVQPMITMRYSKEEFLDLIQDVNREIPNASGFYVVDSFGEMHADDMLRLIELADSHLHTAIALGFHSHNNLQLSYSNAVALLEYPTNRELMLDCSILGMGKGAGNLNTELILQHLNLYAGGKYEIQPLLSVIDRVINQIRAEHYWGYAVEYYLSSVNHCTPSYAAHFYGKHMLSIDRVAQLLSRIPEEKKISFDRDFAEQLYLQYNSEAKTDDEHTIQQLRAQFENKRIILIAPGRSILDAAPVIRKEMDRPNTVSIGLNNWTNFPCDYVFVTRQEILPGAIAAGKKVIATSNICSKEQDTVFTIDYQKWVVVDGDVRDSSGVVAIRLLEKCGIAELLLAGFDGFHVNYNKNYYDKSMNHPITAQQAEQRNTYFTEFLRDIRGRIPVQFLTPSLYEE